MLLLISSSSVTPFNRSHNFTADPDPLELLSKVFLVK